MVYVFLAQGFEELEALAPVDILRRAGVEVCTVGVGSDMIKGSHGIPVKTDITVDKINKYINVLRIYDPADPKFQEDFVYDPFYIQIHYH